MTAKKEVAVLLVEDDPGDVEMTEEALKEAKIYIRLTVVDDGRKALAYLRGEPPYAEAPRPDLVLLDLNLPRKDGREVLREIKQDGALRSIPVVVLTTSEQEMDIVRCYDLGANCYITKPVSLEEFAKVVRTVEDFWFTIVKLPPGAGGGKWRSTG